MGAMATKVQSLSLWLPFYMSFFRTYTYLDGGWERSSWNTDTRVLTRGTNYSQTFVHQSGMRKIGEQNHAIAQTRMDFFHRLSDPHDETPVTGPTSAGGRFDIDVSLFASQSFWKSTGTTWAVVEPQNYVKDIDLPDGAPEISIERLGDVIHWRIELGLLLLA